MDKEKVRRLVEEYAKLVVSNMVVNKIILYGSYARGDFRKDSDIDVAVVAARLGHAQITTTFNFYVHPIISHNRNAGNALENLLLPQQKLV